MKTVMPMSKTSRRATVRSPLLRKGERVVGVRLDKRGVFVRSQEDAAALADVRSQRLLGVPSSVAFRMLQRGELKGTVAEAELSLLQRIVKQEI